MSGHSKWSNIKRKKDKTDKARAKVFTKIGREISVAVKESGADPNTNSKLRDLISKAKSNNVPNENIDRIIKKAAGGDDKNNYESIVYEGYGPAGVAIIVETLTDNRNRTASNLRHYFDKFGGNLGTTGCVSFMFEKKGVLLIEMKEPNYNKVMEDFIEAGVEDFEFSKDGAEAVTSVSDFGQVREYLENAGYVFASAQLEMIPNSTVKLTKEKDLNSFSRLMEALEEDDDVNEIYTNIEDEG